MYIVSKTYERGAKMKFDHDITLETMPLKIYKVLREAILKGQIQPGEHLVQDDIAKSFGVSRMPVREAIKQLAAEGFVVFEPHKGAIVKKFTKHELEEIYFLRSKFEPLAAFESLKLITENQIQQLISLVEEMNEIDDPEQFIELNIQFHQLLIENCPWGKLNTIIQSLWTGFPQQTPHLLPNQLETSKKEHAQIIEAIVSKNMEQAASLLEQHILRAKNSVLKNLKY